MSPAAFGAGAAAAEQRAGGQLQQAGSELSSAAIQRQMIVNQTNADDVTNQIEHAAQTAQYGDPNDPSNPGFYALEGSNAMSAYQPTLAKLEQQRTDALNTLTNPRARHMAEQASRRIVDYARGLMGRHYDQAVKTYGIATQTAAINLGMQGIGAAWNNDDIFNNHLADMQNAQSRRDELAGASPEVAQWNQAQLLSKALTARVEGAIPYDTSAASKLLEQAQGKIPAAEYARLFSTIQTKSNMLAATHGANNFITNLDSNWGNTPQNAGGGTDIKGAILGQESGNRDNIPVSANGAVGPGQIMPETFARYARPGENIDNPQDNRAVSARIVDDLQKKYPNDPARVAVGYFSGEGNVAPPGSATPWVRDTHDANGKSVSSYVSDIQKRLGPTQSAVPQQPSYQTRADYYEQHAAEINDRLQAYAQQQAPDNPLVQDKIIRDVQEHMRTTIQAQNQQIAHDGNTVERWANGDFSQGQKPTAMEQMPQNVRDAYQRWEQRKPVEARALDNVLKANAKTDIGYGAGFYPLLAQVYSHQITDPTKLYSFTGDPEGITSAGLAALTKEIGGATSPQGSAEADMKNRFFQMAREQITSTNAELHQVDPKGDKRFDKFLAQALPAYDQMRKGTDKSAGLTPDEILNPSSAHYLGRMIPSFMPSDSERLSEAYHGNAVASYTPEQYAQQFVDWSTPEKAAAGLKSRIAALPPEQQMVAYEAAAEQLRTRFPQLNRVAPAPPPQAPLAQ